MNEQLRNRLAEIAEDAPSAGLVLQTVRIGHQRRLHRRRWAAATAAAVAVIVATVGVTTVLRPSADGTASVPAPVGVTTTSTATANSTPGTQVVGERAVPSLPLAAGSKLVPFAGATVTSPVSVPASWVSYDADGPDVQSGPDSLQVNWTGKEPTARQTTDVRTGTTGTGQYRGYLVTAGEPTRSVFAPGYDTTAASQAIILNGHAARLLTAPKGSFDNTYAAPAEARITWQLGDRRWIEVWTVGESNAVLTSFASAITERPTEFPANLSIGLTVKGYSVAASTLASYVSQMNGPGLTLCRPASTAPASSSPVSSAAQSASGGSDPAGCLTVYANVADGGFGAGIVMGNESNAKFVADSVGVDVGGIQVKVNAEYQAAWTRWGAATILVQGPGDVPLTTADLAAMAASVRLAPNLGVRNEPDAMVESSLAEQSAYDAARQAAESGNASTGSTEDGSTR